MDQKRLHSKKKPAEIFFEPGELVRENGVYCAEHHSHRLMHVVTLATNMRFPRCKRCGNAVRFLLLRRVKDARVVPFRSSAILEEYPEHLVRLPKAG